MTTRLAFYSVVFVIDLRPVAAALYPVLMQIRFLGLSQGHLLPASSSTFVLVLLVLNASGLGYAQAVDLLDGVPFIGDALASIDKAWGNAAISLAVVEVINVPVLLPLAAVATPGATEALSAKLTEWGFDADGLNAKIEAVLEKTS